MKKYFFGAIIGLLFLVPGAQTIYSQNSFLKNEIYAGYGVASVPQIGISLSFAIGNLLGNTIANGIIEALGGTSVTYTEEITGTGAISLGYNGYLSPRFYLGGQTVYERVTDKLVFSNGNTGKYHIDVGTLMLRGGYNWVNQPGFKLYSSAAIGGSLWVFTDPQGYNDMEMDWDMAYQVTPLGLRFGKKWGLYIEGGFGWTGLIAAGISGKF